MGYMRWNVESWECVSGEQYGGAFGVNEGLCLVEDG